ncbi:hypothetical protein HOC13_03405 [Candidatus Woesearchaeota archaeon]|nr:hypothetical protein [Candidatus Woesearchaeota archaeon]
MKFDVKTGERLDILLIGYGLIYESKGPQDRASVEHILKREPIRVGIISTVHERFTRNPEDGHLGIFSQTNPVENSDYFYDWLQEQYGKTPEAAKYLFE